MATPAPSLAQLGARLLVGELRRAFPVAGGDLSRIERIELTDGREAIVKSGPSPRAEAAMLEAISAAGAPAPAVLAVTSEILVLERLPAGSSPAAAWADLGRTLAILHATTGDRCGWPEDYAFGPVAIENRWTDEWPVFWGERRLEAHCTHIDRRLARRVEALARDLGNRLPAAPAPALLHGDLWGGNIVVDGDRISGLVDPACYFGHAEVDLAMLTLFDRPGAEFFENYGPLEPGHAERRAIYSLWPALVHLRLFGAGYAGLVERLLAAAGV